MYIRNTTEEYLVKEGKKPSEDEPTTLTLTEEQWLTRLVKHRGVESQMTVIRYELMELGQEEDDVRTWLLRYTNERWHRGNGEWDNLSYSMQQRLYWIGSEQRAARARIATLDAQSQGKKLNYFVCSTALAPAMGSTACALRARPALGPPSLPSGP